VLERLSAEGVPREKLSEIRAPIGLSIGAVTPEEIAVSILAEVTAVRRGAANPGYAWRADHSRPGSARVSKT
jgi:xanthine dehydrogenase accessory factor